MSIQCKVPGCNQPGTRYSRLCNAHKSRSRRHGHPLQEGVLKQELKPYITIVHNRFKAKPDSNAMALTESKWNEQLDECRSIIAGYHSGRPTQRNEYLASLELVKIADTVPAQEVIETVLAMYLLADADQRRFRTDESFVVQVVRRVRALTDVNVGSFYSHKESRVKRVYRDLPPKTAMAMGIMLLETFGVAGLFIANLERTKVQERRKTTEEYYEALRRLT